MVSSSELAYKRQTFLLVHRRRGTFREEERLRLSDRNSIQMTQNLPRIRSEALIGRRSSLIVLDTVYKWQTKDKRPQRLNLNAMNLQQNSQYLEEAFEFSWSSFADEDNTFPKPTRRNLVLNKFAFGTPWLPDLLYKHWFTSSVWNFFRWVADVPPRKASLSGDEGGETSAAHRLLWMLSCSLKEW